MKSVIIGTAGHIDHGKTALVKALTGINADRLEEEKRRGITIDIGFAHLELPGPKGETLRLGFVDVPGHERFVRNMLAGVGGIDLVLLVIGADESIKPQTREHFDICRLLGIRRGITVLTKSDLVDADTLDVVRLEVEEFVRGSFLEGAPMVAVSSKTGAGIEELKRAMVSVAAELHAKDAGATVRLPIDRVFTMKGFGTVVTGTLVAGTVRKEQELEAIPSGRLLRVRGIEVHGHSAERAEAGQRTALNLAGVATEVLARGMVLTQPHTFAATSRIDARFSLLKSARVLKDRARVHFHASTAETVAEVVIRGAATADVRERQAADQDQEKKIRPGETAFVQLRLAEPLLLLPGDRFILRQFSPVITIGGGEVMDPWPMPKRTGVDVNEFLNTVAEGAPEVVLAARVARRGKGGLSVAQAIAETGWTKPQLERVSAKTLQAKGGGAIERFGEVMVTAAIFDSAKKDALAAVAAFHKANPLVTGFGKEELREKLELGPEVFAAVLDALVRDKKLEMAGELVHAPGRGVEMKDEEAESKRTIEDAFAAAGLKVPALKDVLAGLKVDRARAQKIVTLLLRDRVLVKVSEELVFHREALEGLRRMMAARKAQSAKIDVGAFKEMTGVSRKYAVPLLEWLDRERVTRRLGDERVIL
jgi:selenocysteine-specific elongation factor